MRRRFRGDSSPPSRPDLNQKRDRQSAIRIASFWYPTARIARWKPCRRSCRSSSSRKGRPATSAIPLGASPITLRKPKARATAQHDGIGHLGIDNVPLTDQRLVVHFFRLVNHNMAALVGEGKRNAQQLLQPLRSAWRRSGGTKNSMKPPPPAPSNLPPERPALRPAS